MKNDYIEKLEHKYLNRFYHFLMYVEEDMLMGFQTKEKIKDDWADIWDPSGDGKGISSFATGAERIVYALINKKGIGQPNSAPIGSYLFFEVQDAFINIGLKSVQSRYISDYVNAISIRTNQNSYHYEIKRKNGNSFTPKRFYKPALPHIYTSRGQKKPCLTYFITILYEENTHEVININLLNMPNGQLSTIYKESVIKFGLTKKEVKYNFRNCENFRTLDGSIERIRIIYLNAEIQKVHKNQLEYFYEIEERQQRIN